MRDRESARSPKMRKDREVAPNWKRLRIALLIENSFKF